MYRDWNIYVYYHLLSNEKFSNSIVIIKQFTTSHQCFSLWQCVWSFDALNFNTIKCCCVFLKLLTFIFFIMTLLTWLRVFFGLRFFPWSHTSTLHPWTIWGTPSSHFTRNFCPATGKASANKKCIVNLRNIPNIDLKGNIYWWSPVNLPHVLPAQITIRLSNYE